MTSIALIGATGNIGSRILDEALSRGHRVTGTTRDAAKLPPRASLTPKVVNTADVEGLAAVLKGHDVVVASIKWNEADIQQVLAAIRTADDLDWTAISPPA